MQAATTVLPVWLLVPELRAQTVHSAAPVAALKLPALQAVGAAPVPPGSPPVNPAFATQEEIAVEPFASPVPELPGQPSQESVVTAVSPLYFPFMQSTHTALL